MPECLFCKKESINSFYVFRDPYKSEKKLILKRTTESLKQRMEQERTAQKLQKQLQEQQQYQYFQNNPLSNQKHRYESLQP